MSECVTKRIFDFKCLFLNHFCLCLCDCFISISKVNGTLNLFVVLAHFNKISSSTFLQHISNVLYLIFNRLIIWPSVFAYFYMLYKKK